MTVIASPVALTIWPASSYIIMHYVASHLPNLDTSFFSLCVFSLGLLGPAVVSAMLAVARNTAAMWFVLACACAGVVLVIALPTPEAVCGAPPEPKQLKKLHQGARDVEAGQPLEAAEGARCGCWARATLAGAAQSTLAALTLLRQRRARSLVLLCSA